MSFGQVDSFTPLQPLHLSLVYQVAGGSASGGFPRGLAYAAGCLTNRSIKCTDRDKPGHSANVNQKQLTGFEKSLRKECGKRGMHRN